MFKKSLYRSDNLSNDCIRPVCLNREGFVKKVCAFFITLLVSSGVFALDIPLIFGFGGHFDFSNTLIKADNRYETGWEGRVNYSILSGGAHIFADVLYAELSLGFSGIVNFIDGNSTLAMFNGGLDHDEVMLKGATIHLSLLGKYPFDFDGFQFYPLLGIEGRFYVSMRYTEDSIYDQKKKGDSYQGDASDWTTFWVRAGVGADFYLGEAFFIRSQLTFGIKLNTARENTIQKRLVSIPDIAAATVLGAGGKLVISVGYNFGTAQVGTFSFGGNDRNYGGGSGGSDIYMPIN